MLLVHAGDVVDAVEAKARGVTRLTRTTGVMVRLPKKGKKCNLCVRYEVLLPMCRARPLYESSTHTGASTVGA